MFTKSALKLMSIVVFTTLQISCSKDKSNVPVSNSRDVKYELSGTASGQFTNISAIYIDANGTAVTQNAITLPWSKNVIIDNNVRVITFQTAVANATPNQTITIKIIAGGVVKIQQTGIVQSDGIVTIALPAYIF